MFPRLNQRLGGRLLDRLDLLVQFATLGEYGLCDTSAEAAATRPRGDCAPPRWVSPPRSRGAEARP